jgi:hypothetical protein
VQDELRKIFAKWGLPERMRVDNGVPWGSKGDLPTDLGLWLIGLGVDMIWNPPRRAQQNGIVKRSHLTTQRWAEAEKCKDMLELKKQLSWVGEIQRQFYPAIEGQTRIEAYPELMVVRRPYDSTLEQQSWDFDRVCKFLSTGLWIRLVNKQGQISIYNRNYRVGASYGGQQVSSRFDAQAREWVILDIKGKEIVRHLSKEITKEQILSLQVSRRKPAQVENRANLHVDLLGV